MQAILLEADWSPRSGYPITAREEESRKATMASQVWRNPRYTPAKAPDPTPAPRDVVIQVRACGVCGSDTHCYETDDDGYIIFSGPVQLPVHPMAPITAPAETLCPADTAYSDRWA